MRKLNVFLLLDSAYYPLQDIKGSY